MNNYEEIISFQSLYEANKKCKRCKENKKEVIEYQANLGLNLWDLHYRLKYKKYKIKEYHTFKIYDPKEREIQAISYEDRIVQHSLCDNYLIPLVSKYLINDNVACRKEKGTSYAIKRTRAFMASSYKETKMDGYFIKMDISKFFDSISHFVLKEKLSLLVQDKDILSLLFMLIDSYEKEIDKGLPMGNQTSQFFALLYLNDLDHYVKEKLHIRYYLRYMDDLFMIVENKSKAIDVFYKVTEYVKKEKLIINKKSQIIKKKCGIVFLGYRFRYYESGRLIQTIKKQTKQRILNKVKNSNVLNSYASYIGFIKKTDSYAFLKKFNRVVTHKTKPNEVS